MIAEMNAILNSNKPPEERVDEIITFLDNILNPKEQKRDGSKEYVIQNLSIHDFELIPQFAD